MIKVGLTGNIGSGKTTVASIFQALDIPVYHADVEAKKFLEKPEVVSRIQALFGEKVISERKIDRRALAGVVFSDEAKLNQLNQLIHPFVEADYRKWCESHANDSYTVQEAAILVESGFCKMMDKVVVVAAPQEVRMERILQRDGTTRNEVENRMKRQMPEQELRKYADFVIENDDKQLVIPQVLKIHETLKESV